MSKDLLANLNCDSAVLSADNLSTHLQFLQQAIRDRTRLISAMGYGIVDSADPRYQVSTEVKPLWVDFTPQTYTKVIVSPGRAVTQVGDLINIEAPVIVDVAGLTPGVESLILARYTEVDSKELGRTSDGVSTPVGRIPVSEVTSITKLQWLDPTLTTTDVVNSSVVLGVVIWSDTDAPIIVRDTSNNYTWNRPWFSPVDTYHRSLLGTGTVTSTNPHGIGLADLTVGSRTLYDQLTSTGLVLSKDHGVPGVPGYFCFDSFNKSEIQRDNTGAKTSGSWFAGFNVPFIDLTAFPNTIVYAVDQNGAEVAIDWIRGTKRCILVASPVPTSLTVYYTKTVSLAIASATSTAIMFGGVDADDLVVTGGQARSTALTTTVPLRKIGGLPREIAFKISKDGQVFMDPGVLMAPQSLAGTAGIQNSTVVRLSAPGRIGVGITGMPEIASAFAAVTVTGTLESGESASETLTFDMTNWLDTAVPALKEVAAQVHFTENTYTALTGVLVHNDTSYPLIDVSSATYVVLSKQENTSSKLARLATCFWDGTAITNIRDARRVRTTIGEGSYGYTSLHQAAEIIPGVEDITSGGNRAKLIVAEDFQQPNFLNAARCEWDGIGVLDTPVIGAEVPRSDSVTRCYRSRVIPMKFDLSVPLNVYVKLFGAELDSIGAGSVRIVGQAPNGTSAEGVLHVLQTGDGSDFIGCDTRSWASVSFVISGKCRGFAAYVVTPTNPQPYMMEMV